jgi:DNA-binding Lrp family transcriptional regulator
LFFIVYTAFISARLFSKHRNPIDFWSWKFGATIELRGGSSVVRLHYAVRPQPASTRQNAGCADISPGAMKKNLDDIDRQIVAALQDNARLPLVTLAKSVGLSRSAVQERLQRLERTHVIEKYTVRLGAGGKHESQAWLLLTHRDGFSCDDVMPSLLEMPEVMFCQSVAGEIDLMVMVHTDSLAELAELRERVVAMKGVDDVTTIPVLDVKLDRR